MKRDLDIFNLIDAENNRQHHGIELIASENFVSKQVMEAMGSCLTNKYAEGYPGKRYYGGCQVVDQVEQLSIDRLKKLFGAEYANVQPHSGAQANAAVFFACLKPGDTFMGLDLSHGGHLSHGSPVNLSGINYKPIAYHVDQESGRVDYDEMEKLAIEHNPKMIVAGASAHSRDWDFKRMREIADKVGALLMADIAHIAGLIAGGEMNNPVPIFDVVTTTTHKTLRGPRGGMIMCKKEFAKQVDKAVFPGLQGGPHENNIAGKAVAFKEALMPEFKEYAKQIKKNAKVLEKRLSEFGFKLMFGGTDNHLLLIDVTSKNVTGKEVEEALDKAGITVNKNMIPDDTRSPFDPSGIRLGTPALTTRGMKETEMEQVAVWINKAVENYTNDVILENIRNEVKEMTSHFPLYPELKK